MCVCLKKIDFRFFFRTRQNVNKRMNVADTHCFVEVPGYLPSEVKAELNGKAVLSVGEFANTCRLWRRTGALFISPSVPVCAGTLLVGDQTLPNLHHDSYRPFSGAAAPL